MADYLFDFTPIIKGFDTGIASLSHLVQLIDDISVDEVVSSFAEKLIGKIGQMDFSIGRWRSNKLWAMSKATKP